MKNPHPIQTKLTLSLLAGILLLAACTPGSSAPVPGYPDFSATESALLTRAAIPTTAPVAECIAFDIAPTPDASITSLFPAPTETDHRLGNPNAPITFILYNDFTCPQCAELMLTLIQLANDNPQDVQLIFRQFPLVTVFDKSALAAQAAEAAALQGKFWEMTSALYQEQATWYVIHPDEFPAWLEAKAASLGLDAKAFRENLQTPETAGLIVDAYNNGVLTGLPGAPFLLINGQIHSGPADYNALDAIMRLISLGEKQYNACPPRILESNKQYFATLTTEYGEIVIQLYAEKAPVAVNSFVFLASEGWYDGITFHRVVPGYIAQTGDPSGTGQGNPGYLFKTEPNEGIAYDRPGVVGMINTGQDTNGSQFFITLGPAPQLDNTYTIIGQVIGGMDVLESLTARDPIPGQFLPPGDKILSIEIEAR